MKGEGKNSQKREEKKWSMQALVMFSETKSRIKLIDIKGYPWFRF